MRFLHRSTSIALVALALATSVAAAPIRIGIVEHQDQYTNLLGLGAMLTSEGRTYTDFTSQFQSGTAPDLSDIDCLIIGSFVTNSAQKRATYLDAAEALRTFVAEGGTVILLCQADQDLAQETWMEPPRLAVREDPDTDTAYPLQAGHVLLTTPEQLLPADLTGWRIPASSSAARTSWEAFSTFSQGAVVLGADSLGNRQTLLEFGWGDGRVLMYAMALDKGFQGGNAVSRTGGLKLFRNALAYAQMVEDGVAPPIQITPSGKYEHPIQGVVFMDMNRNGVRDPGEPGRAGVGVSDGVDVVLTNASGEYLLPNLFQNPPFVFVTQPADVVKSPTTFYHFPRATDGPETRFHFPLWPAAEVPSSTVYFAQMTDVHTADTTDRQLQLAACREIYDMTPRVDFVISTGDLVNTGANDSEYQNYLPGVLAANVPFFNVVGNHDVQGGANPVANFQNYFGPDYYSFDHGGIHFVVRNVINTSARQDAWLQKDLALLSDGRPVVFFQHYPPTAAQLAQMDGWNVHSVYTGHWHTEKAVQSATTHSINSPTLVMGGIDCSPAGFQLVWLGSDGSVEKEWRYGGQSRRITVVSPAPGGQAHQREFPVIVNLYDTSVKVVRAHWSVSNFGVVAGSGELTQESPWSWSARFDAGAGNYLGFSQITITATDAAGDVWQKTENFGMDVVRPATPEPVGEWPMFMGAPTHEGRTNVSLGVPMRLAWSLATGGDLDFSSPILAEGKLFLALKARHTRARNGVIAVDPASGQVLWRRDTPQAINHTPAYNSGILCVAEVGGRVLGLSASSGEIVWEYLLLDELGRYNFSAPCAEGAHFYVGTLRRFARLNALTGQETWAQNFGGSDWISSYGSPAVSGNYLAVCGMWNSGDDMLVRNKNTGASLWSHAANNGMHGSPTFAGDRLLFTGNTSTLYCYSVDGLTNFWSRSLGTMWNATTPAVKDNVVVAGSGSGDMHGLNLSNGQPLWTHNSDRSIFQMSPYRRDWRGLLSSPTIADNKVYYGSSDGHLYCRDLTSGAELWKLNLGVPVLSTPLISGNALFVGAYDGRLYAFTPQDQGQAELTPTPTATGTPTPTGTPTATFTPTGTPTSTPTATSTPPPSDVNRSGWVDSIDLLLVAHYWQQPSTAVPEFLQMDWDQNGIVDEHDLLFFVENWPGRN